MCDFNGRLAAWMDSELSDSEAAEVERHLAACSECRDRLKAYERASTAFSAYRDAFSARKAHQGMPRWKWALLGAGAAAAAIMLALWSGPARTRATQAPVSVPQTAPAQRVASIASPLVNPVKSRARVRARSANGPLRGPSAAVEPSVEITIPADAVLPPGAAPQGTIFLVNVSIGADGSAQDIRLSPELTGFERRANQP
jgi:anti-sigma factor RsiW